MKLPINDYPTINHLSGNKPTKYPNMKKIFMLLLLFAGMANAQIIFIPDPNFKASLIAQGIDTNANGEIEQIEAITVNALYMQSASINDLTGIESFTNLTSLACFDNALAFLDVSNLHNLQNLACGNNNLNSLNVSGLSNLLSLTCYNNELASLDLTGLTALTELNCNMNNLTSLNASTAPALVTLRCNNNLIDTLNFSGLANLNFLDCGSNKLTSLDVTGLTNLVNLECNINLLQTLNIAGMANLETLAADYNQLTAIDFSGTTQLKVVNFNSNLLTAVDVSGLSNLQVLNCNTNQLSALDINMLTNLGNLDCSRNAIPSLNVSNLLNLTTLNCWNNQIPVLNINNLTALTYVNCDGNLLTALNVTNLTNLMGLSCAFNQLTQLNTTTLVNLQTLNCSSNQITSIDLTNNSNLLYLNCSINQLTALNVSNLLGLRSLICGNNFLPTLDFSMLAQLRELFVDSTGRTSLDVSNQPLLYNLYCGVNPIAVLDVSNLSLLDTFSFGSAALTQVFMKNGRSENIVAYNCTNLELVCADQDQLPYILSVIVPAGASSAVVTSYCSFTPGGDFNTISGMARFDLANDGCDASDVAANNLKIEISNGTQGETSIINPSAGYAFYTAEGNFTIEPQLENPSYFNVSPATATVNFPVVDNTTQIQDFCLTANGIHPDLEIVIMPNGAARPGFDAEYRLVYKNKGNQALSGTVNLVFDDARTDFVSAIPTVASQNPNTLLWNYTNLAPFESRVIYFTLNINSPLESPSVNAGDILDFTASINFAQGDETPDDNVSVLHQVAINSMDPNAKTCLEGNTVGPNQIGKFLHYSIEFENLGNAEATNVVVKDVIDTTKFDINSLQVLYASNEVTTTIKENVVEFVFRNINLAPLSGDPPVGGHGSILFKIKTLGSLNANDAVENKANIYFDYNHPITTNVARTIFTQLSNDQFDKDQSVSVYPNPVKDFLKIDCDNTIKSIEWYDIQGRLLETQQIGKRQSQLDFSAKANGIYFIRINTANGKKVEKIIKQ